jgi:hypothetical protein
LDAPVITIYEGASVPPEVAQALNRHDFTFDKPHTNLVAEQCICAKPPPDKEPVEGALMFPTMPAPNRAVGADGGTCFACGGMTIRTGTCTECVNCFTSSGGCG